MSFTDAIKSVLAQNYANFNGRARRSEYWYYTLFVILVNAVIGAITYAVPVLAFVQWIVSLALLVPGIAVCVRRLHDIGKSGLFLLLVLIPLVGGIVLLVFYVQDSQPGANQYGENPKGVAGFTA